MLWTALVTIVVFAAAYYVPGRLAYALLPAPRLPEESFAVSLGLGFGLVNTVTIVLYGVLLRQYLGYGLTRPLVLAVALGVTVVLAAVALWRGALRTAVRPTRPTRDQWALWAFTAAVVAFYFVHFESDLMVHSSCILEATSNLNTPVSMPELAIFEGDFDEQRLGIGVVISPLLALFGEVGYRVAYALYALLMPGLGYALGRTIFGSRAAAWATAVLLVVNAYALEIRIYDENPMSATFGTLALLLLVRAAPAPFFAGVALALFLGIRHIGVLMVPALALYLLHRARKGEAPRHAVLSFLSGAFLFLAPEILIHVQRFLTDGRLFEGVPVHPTRHSFLGIDFLAPRPLNWPFVPEPVRSPLQAYPNLVVYPLDIVRRFGLLLVALVPLGAARLARWSRAGAATLGVWFLVPLLLVMFLSNWTEPNKMGIPASALAPFVLAIVGGGVALRERRRALWWRPLAAVAGPLAALLALTLGVRGWDAPLDLRMVTAYSATEHQRPAAHVYDDPPYLRWARDRYLPRPWPAFRGGSWNAAVLGLHLRQAAHVLASPSIGDHRQPLPDYLWGLCDFSTVRLNMQPFQEWLGGAHGPGFYEPPEGRAEPAAEYTLDLNVAPAVAEGALVPGGTGAPPLDLTGRDLVFVEGVTAPWSRYPMMLMMGRDHLGAVQVLVLPIAPGDVPCVPPADPLTTVVPGSAYPDRRIPLRLPVGAVLRIEDVRNSFFEVAYVRFAALESDHVWLSDAELMTLAHRRGEDPFREEQRRKAREEAAR